MLKNSAQKKYNKICKDNKGQKGFNVYSCTSEKCGSNTIYKHLQRGATPEYLVCDCGKPMKSTGYKIPKIVLKAIADLENTNFKIWFRPSFSDVWSLHIENRDSELLNYFLQGGLIDRDADEIEIANFKNTFSD